MFPAAKCFAYQAASEFLPLSSVSLHRITGPIGRSRSEMKQKSLDRFFAAALLAVLRAALAAGCTDIERRGISPIPQNRPASWETRPFGDIHN